MSSTVFETSAHSSPAAGASTGSGAAARPESVTAHHASEGPKRPLPGEAAGVPAGEQDTGVVLEDPVLVAQDGMDQAADGLGRGMAGGGFASEEVDQSGFAEEVPASSRASVMPSV